MTDQEWMDLIDTETRDVLMKIGMANAGLKNDAITYAHEQVRAARAQLRRLRRTCEQRSGLMFPVAVTVE